MKPTPSQINAGLAVAYALKDSAAEPSFNADPRRYVEVIAAEILRDLPEPESTGDPQ